MSDETFGEALIDSEEDLFRQVHPSFFVDGRLSGRAFQPNSGDAGLMSVARSTLTTAELAHRHYTTALKRASAGTWGISVGECAEVALTCLSDPIASDPADAAHAVVDFRHVSSRGEMVKIGSQLAKRAAQRGRLFPL